MTQLLHSYQYNTLDPKSSLQFISQKLVKFSFNIRNYPLNWTKLLNHTPQNPNLRSLSTTKTLPFSLFTLVRTPKSTLTPETPFSFFTLLFFHYIYPLFLSLKSLASYSAISLSLQSWSLFLDNFGRNGGGFFQL